MQLKTFTFLILILLAGNNLLVGQDTFFAVASGPWSDPNTWANSPGGTPGSGGSGSGDFPATGDNVLTQGFNISIGAFFVPETVTCNNLAISHNTANSIQYGGLFSFAELIIEGGIAAYDASFFTPTAPTVAVIQNTPSLTVTLTGSGALPIVDFWSVNAPFYNLNLDPGAGQTVFFNSPVAIGGGTFNVRSGTFNSNTNIQDLSSPATSVLDVNAGATMNVNAPVNGDGSTTSLFNQVNINGTIRTTSYLNANTVNLNASGILHVDFSGADQTQGWWHTTASPATLLIDPISTVNFDANADQSLPAISYGNLELSSTGPTNKTLEGTGNFIVNGTFTVASSSITFNSNAGSSSDLDFRGDIINFGSWGTLVNTNLRLNGSLAQDISGGNPINIQGLNIIVDNAAGVTVSNSLSLDQNLVLTNGALTQLTGGVTFNGSSLQTISGAGSASFIDMTIDNDLDNESSVSASGIVTLDGGVVFDADGIPNNGNFTLLSSSTGTARVATIPNNSNFGGNVTVQRYMKAESAAKPIFRYISSPVTGSTVNDWNNNNPLANTNTYVYNETIPGASAAGWTKVNSGTSLSAGRGFSSLANASAPITLEVTGTLNQGNIGVSLDYTNNPGDDDVGWNLVGNPYASSIDWDLLGKTGNVDDFVFVSSNGATGQVQYLFWGQGIGSLTGGVIASGQSFWARATGNGASLSIREGDKITPDGAFYRTSNEVTDVLSIKLSSEDTEDVTFIRLKEDTSGEYGEFTDLVKRSNGTFNISTISEDNQRMAVSAYDQLENGRIIPLDIYRIKPGTYTIQIEETFGPEVQFVLIDQHLGEEIPIDQNGSDVFSYNFEVTTDASTYGPDRFAIRVGESLITGLEDGLDGITLYPNPLSPGETLKLKVSNLFENINSVDISIIDRNGSMLSEQTLPVGINGSVEINMDGYSSGVYILRAIGNSETHHFKLIKN